MCAGNVLTSQRIVDVIFLALEACAASQGCMNNFTFGLDGEGGFGYYETICGGSGAGPTWHGTSGVHTNMTNTRITDPESLERRYPVILRHFALRPGSGGRGKYNGGDGIVRDVEFRIPMTASILRASSLPTLWTQGWGRRREWQKPLDPFGRTTHQRRRQELGQGQRWRSFCYSVTWWWRIRACQRGNGCFRCFPTTIVVRATSGRQHCCYEESRGSSVIVVNVLQNSRKRLWQQWY